MATMVIASIMVTLLIVGIVNVFGSKDKNKRVRVLSLVVLIIALIEIVGGVLLRYYAIEENTPLKLLLSEAISYYLVLIKIFLLLVLGDRVLKNKTETGYEDLKE